MAEVDGIIVDETEFLTRLKEARKKMNLPDNGEIRRGLLKEIVNEKLFLVEANQNNFDTDARGKKELERLEIQQLLDIYTRKEILDKVIISEEMIKEFYIQSEQKLKARHIYAATKNEADSLYNLLKEGATFNDLAKEVFNDPYLKNSGGDLGYFSYNDMEHSFSDMAYSLKIGEISRPVKTNSGYSIIKVENRTGNPFTTQTEYFKKRSKVLPQITKRENKKAVKKYADSIASVLEIKINYPVFDMLFKQVRKRRLENRSLENFFDSSENLEDGDKILAETNEGSVSLNEFKDLSRFTSDGQKNWLTNKENLHDFITGLLVRKQIIHLSKEKDFDDQDYTNKVKWRFNSFLIERVKLAIKNDIQISADSLIEYYNKHQEDFLTPPMINLREIVVNDKQLAKSIKNDLNNRKLFQELAGKYSISQSANRGGETGFIAAGQLENLAGPVFALKPNEWRGPFTKDKIHFFLQCIEKKRSAIIPFADAREDILVKLKKEVFSSQVDQKLLELKSNVKMASYPNKLREIRYN